jgi:cellobiose phosphorylase
MIPPVLPEYCNGQGRGLYLFLTGSASWYIYTLFEEVLGIKFFFGDLILEPKLLAGNFKQSDIKASFSFRKKDISVLYTKSSARSGPYTISRLFVNEKPVAQQDNRWVIKFADMKKGANVIKAELI